MFVAQHFFGALAWLVDYLLWAYMWIIIIRALLSWVNPDPYNPIVRFMYRVTEPVLRPIRDRLPTYQIGLDLSPMIAILAIIFLQRFLVPVLFEIAGRIA
jgi:YggT family protein